MQDDITLQLSICGQFRSGEFPDWICHRAGVLNLAGWVKVQDDTHIEVLVHGNPVLLEALELACSIGPYSVTVDDIEATSAIWTKSVSGFVEII